MWTGMPSGRLLLDRLVNADTDSRTNVRVDLVGDLESPPIILWVSLCLRNITNQYCVASAISEIKFGTDLPRCRKTCL